MKTTFNIILCFVITVLFSINSVAQPEGGDIIIGQSFSLTSQVLEEERPYLVYLPDDYEENGNPLSVMYLLDGDGHFHHTSGIVSFLKNNGRIPNMMIVAVPNTTDRTRDLTPKIELDMQAAQQSPTAGGADNMLAFLKNELIPHIDKTYHTAPFKILTGHSLGGIFAVHSLLTEPDLFDAYISISPSMWWDNQNLVAKAEEFLSKEPKLDCFFYMTMGNEGEKMLGGAMKLAALFEEIPGDDFKWDFKVMEEETHGSIPHRSTYYGLEAIFKGWFSIDYPSLYASGGLDGILNHFNSLSDRLGYKMLPSESALNNQGYNEMGKGKIEKALEIFNKNVELFPTSFNVYDSAAEGYMEKGENKKAITYYKKSMELNPGNTNGIEMLKKLGVTYDPAEFAVELNSKEMKNYVGEYGLSVGGILSVKIEDNMLVCTHPAITKQTLFYYSNNVFLTAPDNIPMTFEVDDKNVATSFEAVLGIGQTVKGTK